jgi:hypothetical protein
MPIYITTYFLPWLTLVFLVRVVLWESFNFSRLIQGEYNYNLLGQLVCYWRSLFFGYLTE